ncbi:MAG: hypothetical protein V3T84_02265 [Phycisphaerales bacterium]
MPLEPGGYADKIGNRYEGRWVVRQILRLLSEDLSSLQLEAVGDDEYGVDLWVQRPDGLRVGQQCKIRNGSYDRWSVADLDRRGILDAMKAHLDRDDQTEFMLVTAVSFAAVHDVCESARRSSGDPESFFQHQIQDIGEERRTIFRRFCESLELDSTSVADRAHAYSYLRRLYIEIWPDSVANREDLLDQAGMLVAGDPTTTVAVLADYAVDRMRHVIDASSVWSHLESRGLRPRRLPQDTRVLPAIRGLQEQFVASIQPDLIGGSLIPREATGQILRALEHNTIVAVHGHPGQGKSAVMLELTQRLAAADVAYLPIRLDRQTPKNNSQDFGESLGLPESPVACLHAAAGDRPCVLVLDQLDALRWTSHHSLNALEVCKALVREVRGHRALGVDIAVVLACRNYDIENDPEIKKWIAAEKGRDGGLAEITVGPLKPEAVAEAAKAAGLEVESLSARQKDILTSPQHLAMWLGIAISSGGFEFQSRVQLMREYWNTRMRELRQQGANTAGVQSVLDSVISFMEQNSILTAPTAIVGDLDSFDALLSVGILRTTGEAISFAHQSYLDYQIASRVVREVHSNGRSIVSWLGSRDNQSLFRREQLRQALCLLGEDAGATFGSVVNELLDSAEVRFHLKHLCLEVVGQVETPSDQLVTSLIERVQLADWREHILTTVFRGHAAYVRPLIERGTLSRWLHNHDERNAALWLLRTVAESIPDDVVAIVEPFADVDDEWRERVLSCLAWNAHDDSEAMFSLRLRLASEGTYREFVDWRRLQAHRRLPLLEAVLQSVTAESFREQFGGHRRRSRFEQWTDADMSALLEAARQDAGAAWSILVAQIWRLAPQVDEPPGTLEQWLDSDREGIRQGMEGVPFGLTAIAREAGRSLAETDGEDFWALTGELRELESPVIQNLLIETYAALPPPLSNRVIEWLLCDSRRFSLGTGRQEPKWMPARRLVAALSPHCDDDVFRRLEDAICSYHSPTEKRDAEYWLTTWKRGYFGDYWGRCQYFLLPALPMERRSETTEQLVGVLNRKYQHYPEENFMTALRVRGGSVGSTLPADLLKLSDEAWLGIVTNKKLTEEGSHRWIQVDDDHVAESSIRQFSRKLEQIAKRFPARFGRLALRLPHDVHPSYKTAILDGLKLTDSGTIPEDERPQWHPAPVDLIEQVLERFHDEASRDFASAFCWLLHSRAEDEWSEAALSRLIEFATTHPHPEVNALSVGNAHGDFDASRATPEALTTDALNCVRGVAGLAIGAIIRNHPDLLERMRSALQHLCDDHHPAVRVAGVQACLPVLAIEKDFAIECFRRACESDPRLTASRAGIYFFNCGMDSHAEIVAPLIVQMVHSESPVVAQEGAEEVAARWLFGRHFEAELQECLAGSIPQRRGVAQIAAHFVTKPEYFASCEPLVSQLMNDPEAEVRNELRRLVCSRDVLLTSDGVGLVQRFVNSQAFVDDPTGLLYGLDEHSGDLIPFSEVLFSAVNQFVGPLLETSRDMSFAVHLDVDHLNRLLLRLYEQAVSAGEMAIANSCLDAWDVMFEQRVGGAQDVARAIA